ncbi:MAG: heavy metal-binding domain-containing protein [Candidatus Zixiibacteriota bacterium]
MIVTTTPTVQGKEIKEYLGIVTGEAIMGANLIKDIFASITDVVGGRSAAYEKELTRARNIAVTEMEENAAALGANAIVGVDLDYETVRQGMLMVTVSGTAVKI